VGEQPIVSAANRRIAESNRDTVDDSGRGGPAGRSSRAVDRVQQLL